MSHLHLNENAEERNTLPTGEPLPYALLSYPHQDLAVVSGDAKGVTELAHELGMRFLAVKTTAGTRSVSILSATGAIERDGHHLFFSGTARGASRLIFGQDDFFGDVAEIGDEVGDHVVVVASADETSVRTDYFGISKLFAFHDDRHFVVSNRYHLLLLILLRLGKQLTLDKQKLAANFVRHTQPFTQQFVSRMEVDGVKMLPVGHAVLIRKGDAEIVETALRSDIRAAAADPVEDYAARVATAANEIVSNLEIALKHPRFKHVRVDLTAGLDARLVFGALSRLPHYAEKVRIHTADVSASPEDLPISLALTNNTVWKYDDIPRTTEYLDRQASQAVRASFDLGAYYGRNPVASQSMLDETLRISGFYGEIAARPYYARILFGRVNEEVTDAVIAARAVGAAKNDEQRELAFLRDLLATELPSLPGATALERWDFHYLAFRNGLHCSDRWLARTVAPSWGPLQAKALFRLKCAVFQRDKSIRLQLDIINELNPSAARMPFGREKDNNDRQNLRSVLLDPNLSYLSSVPETDRSDYDAAAKVRKNRATTLNPEDRQEMAAANLDFIPRLRASANEAAALLVENNIVDQDFVDEQILNALNTASDSQLYTGRSLVLINKLLDAAHQIRIVSTSAPKAEAEPIHEPIAAPISILMRLANAIGIGRRKAL